MYNIIVIYLQLYYTLEQRQLRGGIMNKIEKRNNFHKWLEENFEILAMGSAIAVMTAFCIYETFIYPKTVYSEYQSMLLL